MRKSGQLICWAPSEMSREIDKKRENCCGVGTRVRYRYLYILIAQTYGFENAGMEELIATRDW